MRPTRVHPREIEYLHGVTFTASYQNSPCFLPDALLLGLTTGMQIKQAGPVITDQPVGWP